MTPASSTVPCQAAESMARIRVIEAFRMVLELFDVIKDEVEAPTVNNRRYMVQAESRMQLSDDDYAYVGDRRKKQHRY